MRRVFAIFILVGFSITPTLISAETCVINRTLVRGSSGTDVGHLQNFLKSKGYFSGETTSYFGLQTERAVQSFQVAYAIAHSGTPATTGFGAVGPKTRAAIQRVCTGSESVVISSGTSLGIDQLLSKLNVLRAQIATLQNSGSGSADTSTRGAAGSLGGESLPPSISGATVQSTTSPAQKHEAQSPVIFSPPFRFFIRDYGMAPWTGETLLRSLAAHTLGSLGFVTPTGATVTNFAEWDYTYYFIPPGTQIGDGTYRDNRDCYNGTGCYSGGPSSKAEGYERLKSYFMNHRPSAQSGMLASTVGHDFFSHYGAEWGADIIMSEVGVTIDSVQAHIAFSRGAARQYGKAWGIDVSNWYGPAIRDYSSKKVWGAASCASCGHSDSLTKRIYFSAYAGGAQYLFEEAGIPFFAGELKDSDGVLQLSSYGKIAQDFYMFAKDNPVRGTPLVPVAVILEHTHGMGLSFWSENKPWNNLNMDSGDYATAALFGQVLFPNAFNLGASTDERGFLVNMPLGDTVDVLTDRVSRDVLRSYSTVILSGSVEPYSGLASALESFRAQGGAIIFQSGIPSQKALYEHLLQHTSGPGNLYMPASLSELQSLVMRLNTEVLPFTISGAVSYGISQVSASEFLVTLTNNRGVSKGYTTSEVIDRSADTVATITSRKPLASIEIEHGQKASVADKIVSVPVPAGGVSVIRIRTGN